MRVRSENSNGYSDRPARLLGERLAQSDDAVCLGGDPPPDEVATLNGRSRMSKPELILLALWSLSACQSQPVASASFSHNARIISAVVRVPKEVGTFPIRGARVDPYGLADVEVVPPPSPRQPPTKVVITCIRVGEGHLHLLARRAINDASWTLHCHEQGSGN